MPSIALRFEPVFREYLWGGRRLGEVLGKPIGDGPRYAESWEVVDHGEDQSVVCEGEWSGWTLGRLVAERGEWLLGEAAGTERFPLLMKYLDCNRNLSIQVHPDDQRAAKLDPPDLGKTEAWYIIDAQPNARLYAGLQDGVVRGDLAAAIEAGDILRCLHAFEPAAGDCIFIPAGVVHALGEGLLVAEIQQASDTTYRLDDWGRVGPDGQPRALHVEAGLEAADYAHGPVQPQIPVDSPDGEYLVRCDKFELRRRQLSDQEIAIGGDNRFHIVSVVSGAATLVAADADPAATSGTTLLIPAASEAVTFHASDATLLQAHLPQ